MSEVYDTAKTERRQKKPDKAFCATSTSIIPLSLPCVHCRCPFWGVSGYSKESMESYQISNSLSHWSRHMSPLRLSHWCASPTTKAQKSMVRVICFYSVLRRIHPESVPRQLNTTSTTHYRNYTHLYTLRWNCWHPSHHSPSNSSFMSARIPSPLFFHLILLYLNLAACIATLRLNFINALSIHEVIHLTAPFFLYD